MGPGVLGHNQHGHLRARAHRVRVHRARALGGLQQRGVPGAAGRRAAALRCRGHRLLGGRWHARGVPSCPHRRARPDGAASSSRLPGGRWGVGRRGERHLARRRDRGSGRDRPRMRDRRRCPPRRVLGARVPRTGAAERVGRTERSSGQCLCRGRCAPARRRHRARGEHPRWGPARGGRGHRRQRPDRLVRSAHRRREGLPGQDR
ncbi:unannotated protein [freshwater metagenome]|uniref:Unannotated protein n=1 Tax=freshwater metagenome TaxID=449393 RepID=A0A6J7UT65_9ZZZZ